MTMRDEPHKELRILILEDVEADAELMERALRKEDVSFVSRRVETRKTFLEELNQFDPDVVLADYVLPDFDGISALHLLLERMPATPLIIVTGKLDEETAASCIKEGAADYVLKEKLVRLPSAVRSSMEKKRAEDELRKARERYRDLFEQSRDAIYITTVDGQYVDLNPAAMRLLGYDREELMSVTADSTYLDSAEREKFQQAIQRDGYVEDFEVRLLRKDGTQLDCLVTSSVRRNRDGSIAGYQGIIRDITQQKKDQKEIVTQLERLRSLRAIDNAISGSVDLSTTLGVVLDQVTSRLEVDAASVLLLEESSGEMTCAAARGFRTSTIEQITVRLGRGYAGRAAATRKIVTLPSLSKTEAGHDRIELLKEAEGFQAYFAVPLIAKARVKGVLEVFHRAILAPDNKWVQFLETLGGQAAIAIDSTRLFEDLQKSNTELRLAYDATIEAMARTLELRDRETEEHAKRVMDMTVLLARSLQIERDELEHIRRGALLHDIGKIGIPDSILLKEGKLTEEEWKLMRQHPVLAYKLLSPIKYLRPALDIPYCHHEKWDGSGYPRGLKGEEIPLAARVFAIVDVWDALSAKRPYSDPWPPEEVRKYLKENAGTHFDPNLVDPFLDLISATEGE